MHLKSRSNHNHDRAAARSQRKALIAVLGAAALAFATYGTAPGQPAPEDLRPPSLKGTTPPPVVERISGLDLVPNFVVDKQAAVELGKALFWDVQVGSDGQACASCHFHAGADNRTKNQLTPAFIFGGNNMFDPTGSGGAGGPNYTLIAEDFPFHRLSDPDDRNSEVEFDTDDVASSQGAFGSEFNDIIPGVAQIFEALDDCDIAGGGDGDPTGFHVGGINVRRVEPRNTPTVVNAELNFRNFWDGRANNIFNGVNPFGRRDPNATILEVQMGDFVEPIMVEFENSSLASQAVGPPLSPFEMSCAGRAFANLGKKMLNLPPLGLQNVHADDSVLGDLAVTMGADPRGLTTSYEEMIQAAFDSRFWDSDELFDITGAPLGVMGVPADTTQFTMMEINFSFFWGLAIQLYENQLISDDTPFDNDDLSEAAARGLEVFTGDGKCINCHATAMFTKASTLHLVDEAEEEGLVERMNMGDEQFHYSVRRRGVIKRTNGSPAYHIIFDAEGTPGVDGDNIVPGLAPDAAGGEMTLLIKGGGKKTCVYAVDSFTLDADGAADTLDALVTGSLSEETEGCPSAIEVLVIDDRLKRKRGRKHCDHITVLDAGNDYEEIFSTCTSRGNVQILGPAIYDNGFYNIAVRPTHEDLAVGAEGEFGHPLSFSRQYLQLLRGKDVPDPFQIDECTFEIRFDPILDAPFYPGGFDEVECEDGSTTHRPTNNEANRKAIIKTRVAVDGAFKVPGLRNSELQGPFFHNGGDAFLEQVVAFYNRGANFPDENKPNLDPDITALGLSDEQRDDLVAFLKSLTDDRVRCQSAPFDHPELFITDGHPGDETMVTDDGTGQATDLRLAIPATGADGRADCPGPAELVPFLE